jgi:catechol 2,3-dioxygenase-like lactoylglutathione lyase family enzyme
MITGLAQTGVCVPDCEAAVVYYRDVLGFTVLSPQYGMDGDAICDDLDETRKSLEDKGVRFLVDGIADIAGVRTTWFADPWGVVFILPRKRVGPQPARGVPPVEKGKPERPYFAQVG